jgi:hypothetical protein
MQSRVNPVLAVILVIVAVLAVGLAIWYYRSSQPSGEIPQSAYPQPQTGQPTVEQVGPHLMWCLLVRRAAPPPRPL